MLIAHTDTPTANGTRAGRVELNFIEHAPHQWVTGWRGRDGDKFDSSWCWGHYFENETEARDDYRKQVARGY